MLAAWRCREAYRRDGTLGFLLAEPGVQPDLQKPTAPVAPVAHAAPAVALQRQRLGHCKSATTGKWSEG